jgi:WD40 repeat protein
MTSKALLIITIFICSCSERNLVNKNLDKSKTQKVTKVLPQAVSSIEKQVINIKESINTKTSAIYGVSFSPDGSRLAYAHKEKVYIINTKTKELTQTLEGAVGDIYSIIFTENRIIASGDWSLAIWDLKSSNLIKLIERKNRPFTLSFCKKRNVVYTGGETLDSWDVVTGSHLTKFKGLKQKAEAIAVTQDGNELYISPIWGNSTLIFDTKSGKQIKELTSVSGVRQILFHPNGHSFYTSKPGGEIDHFDLEGKSLTKVSIPSTPVINTMSISDDGRYLLMPTGSNLGEIEKVYVYETKKNTLFKSLHALKEPIRKVIINKESSVVAVTTDPNLIHFFELPQN